MSTAQYMCNFGETTSTYNDLSPNRRINCSRGKVSRGFKSATVFANKKTPPHIFEKPALPTHYKSSKISGRNVERESDENPSWNIIPPPHLRLPSREK
jgi:hypothetical protein